MLVCGGGGGGRGERGLGGIINERKVDESSQAFVTKGQAPLLKVPLFGEVVRNNLWLKW